MRVVIALAIGGVLCLALPVRGTSLGRSVSLVWAENQLPGTKAWSPLTPTGPARAIEGYASDVSVLPGRTIDFHVSTSPAVAYQIKIYRLGYYQGLGGRLITCLPSCNG